MSIRVITFIQDAAREDELLSALVSGIPSCELVFRARSLASLEEYCAYAPHESESIILIHDQNSPYAKLIPAHLLRQFRTVDISQMNNSSSEIIAHDLARTIREDHVAQPQARGRVKRSGLISITGTSGSPGITSIAINVARELSEQMKVALIDLDQCRRDIAHHLGGRSGERLRSSQNLRVTYALDESDQTELVVVDLGSAPELKQAIGDRRSHGREFLSVMEQSETLLYIVQPESSQLHELENFLTELSRTSFAGKLHIIHNKFSSNSRNRAAYKRARALSDAWSHHMLPWDLASMERAKNQLSTLAESVPRSKLRRAVKELASTIEVDIPATRRQ